MNDHCNLDSQNKALDQTEQKNEIVNLAIAIIFVKQTIYNSSETNHHFIFHI